MDSLKKLGITDIFGVPGDYSFPICDAICKDKELRWVGCCNELNAAYAADGYARMKGVAVLNTTFAVGELSAINGIAGSYAEHVPVIHIVGMPRKSSQKKHDIIHHSLEGHGFEKFFKAAEQFACAAAIITPENCVQEMERIIEILKNAKDSHYH